jgi:uncharacterized repeat protein (TIGR02543 family)
MKKKANRFLALLVGVVMALEVAPVTAFSATDSLAEPTEVSAPVAEAAPLVATDNGSFETPAVADEPIHENSNETTVNGDTAIEGEIIDIDDTALTEIIDNSDTNVPAAGDIGRNNEIIGNNEEKNEVIVNDNEDKTAEEQSDPEELAAIEKAKELEDLKELENLKEIEEQKILEEQKQLEEVKAPDEEQTAEEPGELDKELEELLAKEEKTEEDLARIQELEELKALEQQKLDELNELNNELEELLAKEEKSEEDLARIQELEALLGKEPVKAVPEILYPPLNFVGLAGGVLVNVEAVEGTFPEGTKMKVEEVEIETIIDAVSEALGDEAQHIDKIKAVDITFYDKDNEPIQPLKPVSVKMNAAGMFEEDNRQVLHIEEDEEKEELVAEIVEDVDTTEKAVAFEADKFSVYVVVETVVPRLTVTFKNGDTTIETMYVKDADTEAEVEKILYDPGAGTVPAGQVFKGWTTEQNYTAETEFMTIDEVRSDAMERAADLNDADDSVTYYAGIFNQFNVAYVDGAGTTIGIGIVEVPSRETSGSYTVNMAYPTDSTHNLEGWIVSSGGDNIAGYPGNAQSATIGEQQVYYYPNDTKITISGNVTFSVNAPEGHWLVFDENGKGATYNAPRFYKAGEVTSDAELLEMVRSGYTFGGWYTDAACTAGNEFSFGSELTDNTTIYAKWTAITQAPYTVIIWKQNLTADGYDFETSIPLTGNANSTINTVTQQGTGNNAYARISGTNYQYTGFSLDSFDQNVTINPEGTAVVNVYYNRNEYTLTFRRNQYSGTVYKTITALYGQPIGSNFPISVNGDTTYRWQPHNSSTFNQVLVYIDVMPAENVTFSRNDSTAITKYMEFYVEALPGQTGTRTFNGKSFIKFGNTIPAKYNFFTEAEDFVELIGYKKFGSDPAFGSNGQANPGNGGTLYLYYTRKEYPINFMDGAYYDGNGNRIATEVSTGQLHEIENIAYGAILSSYNVGGDDYYEPTHAGYIFEGWYIDDACTHPYTFTNMPEGGITVYAKWRQIQYRVFLHPNAGTDSTLDWGSDDQQMNFRVSYGGKISAPDGTRTGYEFFGWYTDDAMTHAFSSGMVLNDSTVTTPYDKTTHMTDKMDKWGNVSGDPTHS